MATLLQRVQARNESWFVKQPSGTRVRGVIQPIDAGSLPNTTFNPPRTSLRCRPGEPVQPRDILRQDPETVWLVAEHDPIGHVFALFRMTEYVLWERRETGINPVTKRPTGNQQTTSLSYIWAAIESQSTGNRDGGLNVGLNPRRCITNADLQLGDVVAGQSVKHLNLTLGITIAEIE